MFSWRLKVEPTSSWRILMMTYHQRSDPWMIIRDVNARARSVVASFRDVLNYLRQGWAKIKSNQRQSNQITASEKMNQIKSNHHPPQNQSNQIKSPPSEISIKSNQIWFDLNQIKSWFDLIEFNQINKECWVPGLVPELVESSSGSPELDLLFVFSYQSSSGSPELDCFSSGTSPGTQHCNKQKILSVHQCCVRAALPHHAAAAAGV